MVPEKMERSGALQSQVLLGGTKEDEVQDSAQIEVTPPNSLRKKTTWIRTELPTGAPVVMPDDIFEGAQLPSSGSSRASANPLLYDCLLILGSIFLLLGNRK